MYPEEVMGIGNYVGELRQGPDGNLYQWEVGMDGLGNPIGFWKLFKKVRRAVGKGLRAVRKVARIPIVRKLLPVVAGAIPGVGPAVASGVRAAQAAGVLGLGEGNYIGELRQDENGNLYQWEEGVDGLGNPIGFWKLFKKVRRAVGKGLRAVRRVARMPGVSSMLKRATPGGYGFAKQHGLLGHRGGYSL